MSDSLRQQALEIWYAGTTGVRADRLVRQTVTVEPSGLQIAGHSVSFSPQGRVCVIGAGKAAAAMVAGLEETFDPQIATDVRLSGWINVPKETLLPLSWIHLHAARPLGCNEPTDQAAWGTEQILGLCKKLTPRDICIVLVTGGCSALLTAPIAGITLQDKLALIRLLVAKGANIEELNTVRKHLSRVKGGRLSEAAKPARIVTLLLSDVLGDRLDIIGSGPTIADHSSVQDAQRILNQFDPNKTLPKSIYQALHRKSRRSGAKVQRMLSKVFQRRRAVNDSNLSFVLGNNAMAVDIAGIRAEQLGFHHAMVSAVRSDETAKGVGYQLADMAVEMLHRSGPDCLISGGEPTVQLADPSVRGRGGRNQQVVLEAMQRLLDHHNLTSEQRDRIAILSAGTDGEDGPTDAAGAILDARVWRQWESGSIDLPKTIIQNNAYSFFDACDGLIKTGRTDTNVCDLRVVVIRQKK